MNLRASVAVAAMLVVHPTTAQDHHFETDRVVTVRENFVACDVLSQLQRVMDNPRFLLSTQAAGHMSVSIQKTRSRRANGHTRKCCRNNPARGCRVRKPYPYDHAAWFLGARGLRPRWLGYTLGYEIVGKWLDGAGEVDGITWINVPAHTILSAQFLLFNGAAHPLLIS